MDNNTKIIEGGQDKTVQVVFQVRQQPRKKPLTHVGNIEFDENGQFVYVGSAQDFEHVSNLLAQHAVFVTGDPRLDLFKGAADEPVQGSAAGGDGKPKGGKAGKAAAGSGGNANDGKGANDAPGAGSGAGTPGENGPGPVSQEVTQPEGGSGEDDPFDGI